MDNTARKRIIAKIVKQLDLDNPDHKVNKVGSDDFALAQHEEDSRGIVLVGTTRPFLQMYTPAFPLAGFVMEQKEMEAFIDVALHESVFLLTQHLLKCHYRKMAPLSSGELAKVLHPQGGANWDKFKQYLAHKVYDPMHFLQMWNVNTLTRKDTGGGSISGYQISAGQALLDFDKYVFQPKRLKQHQDFYRRFSKDIGKGE